MKVLGLLRVENGYELVVQVARSATGTVDILFNHISYILGTNWLIGPQKVHNDAVLRHFNYEISMIISTKQHS